MSATGERQTEQERAEAADEEAVRPLLARANLLRMRQQWDDAVTACTEALRRAPRSANAHAMLGNIYDSQGKSEDAIEWYMMAKEIRPLSPADAAQLEKLLDFQRVKLRTGELSNTMPMDQKPVAEKTLEWFDRIFPPGRSDGLARLILAMSASVALVIAICATLIYFYVSPKREEAQADALQAGAADTLIAASPIVMTPTQTKSAASVAANSALAPPEASASPSVANARNSTDTSADLRAKVAQALEGGGASISALTLPPGTGAVGLDLTLPGVKGETIDHLRERAVRIAGLATRAVAASASDTAQKILLRLGMDAASLPSNGGTTGAVSSGGRSAATVIFVGSAGLRSFRNANVAGLTTSDLLARFETTQWHSALNAGVAAPAATQGSSGASPLSPSAATPSPSAASAAATVAPAGTTAVAPTPSPSAAPE